ncbi:hypothetical protein VTO73DRAFT_9252 [Trametes versicolor]
MCNVQRGAAAASCPCSVLGAAPAAYSLDPVADYLYALDDSPACICNPCCFTPTLSASYPAHDSSRPPPPYWRLLILWTFFVCCTHALLLAVLHDFHDYDTPACTLR